MRKYILCSMMGLGMAACAPQGYEAASNLASQTVDDIACKDTQLETKLWDGLKTYLLEQKSIPSADMMKKAMDEKLSALQKQNPQLQKADVQKLRSNIENLVDALLDEAPQGERVESPEQLLILLSALDVGDRSTEFRSYMQTKVRTRFSELQKSVQTLNADCPKSATGTTPDAASGTTDSSAGAIADEPATQGGTPAAPVEVNKDYEYHKKEALQAGVPLSVFGGRWAFATAYQSCQSEQLPAMTNQTPDVQGIAIVGKHPDGVGNKRVIASLPEVQSTHYYIRDMSTYGQGCFNVRANPLIYDYGGKPSATTAAEAAIDLFKNNGDGTSVLGIDCSAYVFSSMATAGLRLKAGRALKASDSWAWGSSSYVEPQQNGLTCLNKISVTPTASLKAGDIVAVYGHVILIDKAGADPFGIAFAKTESDCSKISTDRFDFVVAQSSPSKEGIGINYFEAKDYLPTSAKMKAGLEKYAYYACMAKVQGKTVTPNVGTLSVVRHKGTAECLAPRVKMAREACIQSCGSLVR